MFFGVEHSKSPLLIDDVTILIDPLLEVERLLHFALHVQLERSFIRNGSFEITYIELLMRHLHIALVRSQLVNK